MTTRDECGNLTSSINSCKCSRTCLWFLWPRWGRARESKTRSRRSSSWARGRRTKASANMSSSEYWGISHMSNRRNQSSSMRSKSKASTAHPRRAYFQAWPVCSKIWLMWYQRIKPMELRIRSRWPYHKRGRGRRKPSRRRWHKIMKFKNLKNWPKWSPISAWKCSKESILTFMTLEYLDQMIKFKRIGHKTSKISLCRRIQSRFRARPSPNARSPTC